jgi:DNA repair protein RadC
MSNNTDQNDRLKGTVQIRDITGAYHIVQRTELIKTAQTCITEHFSRGEAMTSPKKSADYFQILLGNYEHETFYALWLDSQHQVLKAQELFRGTVDSATVYPREVVKEGLACNAAAVIFAHNHPSGISEPSQADVKITKRLNEALQLVDIRTLDHLVVGTTVTSMAERGLL